MNDDELVQWELLLRPFPPEMIELRPGPSNSDKTKAQALAYADPRAYMERLDQVLGPAGWQTKYLMLQNTGEQVAIECCLNIAGVTKSDVGHAPMKDPNSWTVASAQAFKRACTMFGLGRYLYEMKLPWLPLNERKQFVDMEQTILRMYKQAGIRPEDWE